MMLTQDPTSCGQLLFLTHIHYSVFPPYYLDPGRVMCCELVEQSDKADLSR